MLTISYDASTRIYILTRQGDERTAVQFSPDSRQSGPEPSNFAYYSVGQAEPTHLTFLNNSPDNTRIALSYLSYGLWDGFYFAHSFLFGTETDPIDMPRTGTATYNGIVDGTWDWHRLLGSTGSLTADFATGRVTTTLSLHATQGLPGNGTADFQGALSGVGTIGSGTSHFGGSLSGTLNNVSASGSFLGGFYGPGASEAGYAFSTTTSNPALAADSFANVTGVFVGKR